MQKLIIIIMLMCSLSAAKYEYMRMGVQFIGFKGHIFTSVYIKGEYKTTHVKTKATEYQEKIDLMVAKMGLRGWDLVSVVATSATSIATTYYFKRKIL